MRVLWPFSCYNGPRAHASDRGFLIPFGLVLATTTKGRDSCIASRHGYNP
jgi:hypothetical protein